jgi:hypothetical protein
MDFTGLAMSTCVRKFSGFLMSKSCRSSSCKDHSHAHDHEEHDPCMAKEIASMERDRILYDKLKTQSDKFLLGLNIRLDQGRTRGPVRIEEDDECHSEWEEAVTARVERKCLFTVPSKWADFVKLQDGNRIFLVASPCDEANSLTQSEIKGDSNDPVNLLQRVLSECPKKDIILSQFSKPICVCSKCEDPERRVSGSLRSLIFLLKGMRCVLVLRSGGMLGMWTSSDGPLESFVSRYL